MEVDDIQIPQPACKFSRVNSNGRIDSSKIAFLHNHHQNHHHVDDSDEVVRRSDPTYTTTAKTTATATASGAETVVGSNHRLRQWQHSSRIIRVSRASGGKDRHSKVWTAKGPRDRRVRLSVTTAIQFYDLQDRLGYDQPSKAVEWLIKAAADAINELPSLNSSSTFPPPETPSPRQLGDEQRRAGAAIVDVVDSADPGSFSQNHNLNQNQQQQQHQMGSSSISSEASKGSGLSLSRSEIRVKARERARERIAMEKEKERETKPTIATTTTTRVNNNNLQHSHNNQQQQQQQIPQTSSFTQLLMAGVSNLNESSAAASSSPSAAGSAHQGPRSGTNQWLTSGSTTAMDYFGGRTVGLMGSSSSRSTSGYSTGLIQVGNQVMSISPFGIGSQENHHQQEEHDSQELHHHHEDHHHHQQHFPFMADHQHLIQQGAAPNVANGVGNGAAAGEYNLNFSISSTSTSTSGGQLNGAGGGSLSSHNNSSNNRGTLQSNSTSLLPYLTRFSTDGSSVPLFLASNAVENYNHNHHHQQFHPPGLQLCDRGDEAAATHTTRRGKEKSSTATRTAATTTTTKSFPSNHSNSSLLVSNLWTQVNNDGAA